MEKSQEVDIQKQLEVLAQELRSYTSLKAVFLRGIVYGVATAIGATVIAAIVLSVLYRIASPIVEQLPLSSAVFEVLEAQEFRN